MPPNAAAVSQPVVRSPRFTVDQANRSLIYVKRVVRDIQRAYRQALAIQRVAEAGGGLPEHETRYGLLMQRLGELQEELQGVGVELKDYDLGLVDFPSWYQDREVCLCWQLGEPEVATWHEVEDGFAGRQPIRGAGAKLEAEETAGEAGGQR